MSRRDGAGARGELRPRLDNADCIASHASGGGAFCASETAAPPTRWVPHFPALIVLLTSQTYIFWFFITHLINGFKVRTFICHFSKTFFHIRFKSFDDIADERHRIVRSAARTKVKRVMIKMFLYRHLTWLPGLAPGRARLRAGRHGDRSPTQTSRLSLLY